MPNKRRQIIRRLLTIGMGCGVAYATGLGLYIATLPAPFATLPAGLQGVAVFTGGAGRVETALRLVQQGFNGPVLISGINPTTRLTDILAQTGITPLLTPAQQQQIMLDGAASTRENMQSLALWANTADLNNIGIITSTYHAARVKLLGWWYAPGLTLTLLPVQPEDTRFIVLLREYNKLLATPFLR